MIADQANVTISTQTSCYEIFKVVLEVASMKFILVDQIHIRRIQQG